MIRVLLGRFFKHCIARADRPRRQVVGQEVDPSFMTDREISLWIHGKVDQIDWQSISVRKHLGRPTRGPNAAPAGRVAS